LIGASLLALLAGCGALAPHEEVSGIVSPPPTRSSIDGHEVKEVKCDPNAFDAIPGVAVTVGEARGMLSLRKSMVCDRLYWSLFTPEPNNKAAFSVTIRVNGKQRFGPQESEPRRPDVSAFTVGVVGTLGEEIQPCLTSGSQTYCLPPIAVV
jgi:hypothetical protein